MERIYLVGWRELGPLKVGIASDVKRRIRELQPGSPFLLVEFYSQQLEGTQWNRKDCQHLEGIIHERLRFVRLCGEWFDVPLRHAVPIVSQTVTRFASMYGRESSHYWRMRLKREQFWYNYPANDRRRRGGVDWDRVL